MVAVSGKGWRLAPSLVTLLNESNQIAPNRSKRSDGSIGDAAHASRTSDHNPSGGYVDAIDITQDLRGGMDAHGKARLVARRRDSRVNYIISEGMIWDRASNRWSKYNGSNGHYSHAHYSINKNSFSRNTIGPWFTETQVTPPPTNVTSPSTPILVIDYNLSAKEDEMKLFRDHDGNIWLWFIGRGTRVHLADANEVRVWKENYQLEMMDLGPGSIFHNAIISAVWLKRIKQEA